MYKKMCCYLKNHSTTTFENLEEESDMKSHFQIFIQRVCVFTIFFKWFEAWKFFFKKKFVKSDADKKIEYHATSENILPQRIV